jgi:hypothetical protein
LNEGCILALTSFCTDPAYSHSESCVNTCCKYFWSPASLVTSICNRIAKVKRAVHHVGSVHQPYVALRMSPRIRHTVTDPTKEGGCTPADHTCSPSKSSPGDRFHAVWRKSKRQGFEVQRSYLCRCMKESVKALREYTYYYLNTNASEYKLAWYRMLLIE